jgi:hypothetical protein
MNSCYDFTWQILNCSTNTPWPIGINGSLACYTTSFHPHQMIHSRVMRCNEDWLWWLSLARRSQAHRMALLIPQQCVHLEWWRVWSIQWEIFRSYCHSTYFSHSLGYEIGTNPTRNNQWSHPHHKGQALIWSLRALQFFLSQSLVLCSQEGWKIAMSCPFSRATQHSSYKRWISSSHDWYSHRIFCL